MDHPEIPPDPDVDSVEEAVALCLAAPPSSRGSVVEDVCSRSPELADEIRARLERLRASGLLDLGAAPDVDGDADERFGDFLLGDVLGEGGMGIVRRAYQISLDREVALKMIRPEAALFDSSRERFAREAAAVARLAHPSIVPVHVAGDQDGVLWFAMEIVRGRSLARAIGEGLAPRRVLELGVQLASALSHAHGQGILHRDVKPSNVLLDEADGRARLVDFGLHRALAADDEERAPDRLTREGGAPGTLLYMAPEVLESGTFDGRSEVYALGATLFEALTGAPPIRGASRSETERMIRAAVSPPAVGRLGADAPRDAGPVVRKALHPDPDRRYPSMDALRDDLVRALEGRPVEARPDGAVYRLSRFARREPWVVAAACALFLLTAVVPTAFWLRERDHTAELEASLRRETGLRSVSEDLAGFAVEVLDRSDPNVAGGDREATRALVESLDERIDATLGGHPAQAAQMRTMLGRIQWSLGDIERARGTLERAAATLEADGGSVDLPLGIRLEALTRLAWLAELRADRETAGAAWERVASAARGAPDGEGSWHLAMAELGERRAAAGRSGAMDPEEARALAEDTARLAERMAEAGEDPRGVARMRSLAGSMVLETAMAAAGEERRALSGRAHRALVRALEDLDRAGLGHTIDTAGVAVSAATAAKNAGELDAAEALFDRAMPVYRARLGAGDHRLGRALVNRSALAEARGQVDEALALLDDGIRALALSDLAGDHPACVMARANRASLLFRANRFEGLRPTFEAIVPELEAMRGARHVDVAVARERLGILWFGEKRYPEARAELEFARGVYVETDGESGPGARRVGQMLAIMDANNL